MRDKKLEIIICIAAVALVGLCAFLYISRDRTAPVFTYTDQVITDWDGAGLDTLLEGIAAADDKDGDVSGNIIINRIVPVEGGRQARVFYAVNDSAGNVAETSRVVNYADAGKAPEITEIVQETKAPSETETSNSTEVDAISDEGESGEDTAGETVGESDEEPETSAAEAGREGFPVLRLTTDEVRISVGETFAYYNYVESATDDKDTRDDLFRRINIKGTYDTSVPGKYELTIYVVDSDGNRSNRETLILIVE